MSCSRRCPDAKWSQRVRLRLSSHFLSPVVSVAPPTKPSRNATLSRENHHRPSPLRAHPRHRLAEGRGRVGGALERPPGPARAMTRLRTGDVWAARQVFVTESNMHRAGDNFNLRGRVFRPVANLFSRLHRRLGARVALGGDPA